MIKALFWKLDSCPVSSAVTMFHHGKKIRLSKEYFCTIYIEELFSVILGFQVSESKIFERDGPNVSSTVTISFTQVTLFS